MNTKDEKYQGFNLIREMLQTADAVGGLSSSAIESYADSVKYDRILLSGEGSSRMFPAKKTIADGLRNDYREHIFTEAATQALEYDLAKTTVFVASNSGKTKEGVRLIRYLRSRKHDSIVGVVANPGTPIMDEADRAYVLKCGSEVAVAATKSVIEQALFYDILFRQRNGARLPDLSKLGKLLAEAMRTSIPDEVVQACSGASTIYFAGRNDGVAEELTLKTNEITRKRSDFLEGTYAVHGVEEVMSKNDVVVIVDPFKEEEEKFADVLEKGVGMKVFAISGQKTRFPTIRIPTYEQFTPYIGLVAGWSLLVEVGLSLGINLDKPERARKIGNEFIG